MFLDPKKIVWNIWNVLANKAPGPYVAEWHASQQKQFGTAWGLISLLPFNVTTTGDFDMQAGRPYFVVPERSFGVSWVGRVPDGKKKVEKVIYLK